MRANRQDLKRRVVITGIGVVSSTGMGKTAFWEAVRDGRSGIKHVTGFDCERLSSRVAGQITDFDPTVYMTHAEARRAGRFTHYSVGAAFMAVEDSGIDLSRVEPFRAGTVFGSSMGGNGNVADDIYSRWLKSGYDGMSTTDCVQIGAHAATSHVFIGLGLRGPNTSVSSGCTTGLEAINVGTEILRNDQADLMIVGAGEASVGPVAMSALCKTGVLTKYNEEPEKASRPYDITRNGLALSEGAGALVLETAWHAMERGATIYAEVVGYGTSTEGQHLIMPDPSGVELAKALELALLQAHLAPDDVDYFCSHGIANVDYDRADTRAAKRVLGERAYNIPISSIKGVTGQPFGPGGVWQVAASCMAMQEGVVPPTINLHQPDPECDLDYVPLRARRARIETVITNSHSFGGTHAAMILRRFSETDQG